MYVWYGFVHSRTHSTYEINQYVLGMPRRDHSHMMSF